MLGVRHLIGSIPNGGVILLQLDLEFRNLQHGYDLAFLDPCSVVHQEIAHITGLFGVDVDLLKRNQLGGHRELALESFPAHLGDTDADLFRRVALGAHFFAPATASQAGSQNRNEAANQTKKPAPAIRSFTRPIHRVYLSSLSSSVEG